MSFLKETIISLPIVIILAILSSQLVTVPTESMSPIINPGDMVLVEKTNILDVFDELDPNDIKVGDIIVYEKPVQTDNGQSESNEEIIHRVIAIGNLNGKKYLILKGDNNIFVDNEKVYLSQVDGRVVMWGRNPILIPKAGYLIFYIKNLFHLGENR